jgi:uncharacterized protein
VERSKMKELLAWKSSKNRKPLIVAGARQVGKSWLVKHFGSQYYTGTTWVINFDLQKDIHAIFEKNLHVNRIIFELELALNIKISLDEDLVFFDEIQACPNAIASLRYFYENMPQLHLIAAGSLLDFEFRNIPFPVGRVDIMDLYPMTFYEFLLARKKNNLAELILNAAININESYTTYFEDELHLYMIVGGMPEVVANFIEYNDLEKTNNIQKTLLYTYEQDFKKYRPIVNSDCLDDILENIVQRLGNQIIYTKLSERFGSATIKKGVDVLTTARLLHTVPNVSVSGLPLIKAGKQFKLFYLDIGLLIQKSGLDYRSLYTKKTLIAAFNGALAEQFVLQQLVATHNNDVCYWARTEQGASSEIDFVLTKLDQIIPIEVKAGKSGSLKSLHYLLSNNNHIKKAIVFSNAKFGVEAKVHFVPLVYAGHYL